MLKLSGYLPTLTINYSRIFLVIFLLGLLLIPGTISDISIESFSGAYASVAVFVYLTLLVFYGLEAAGMGELLKKVQDRPNAQLVVASLLGMLPGCGGAILVVTSYAQGKLKFGALVATLTATMGDAAFLLIATAPKTALIILPVSFLTGIVVGALTNKFSNFEIEAKKDAHSVKAIGALRMRDMIMFALFLPGLYIGVNGLMQRELGAWADYFALTAMIATLFIWAFSDIKHSTNNQDHPLTRANEETAFVMIWVLIAFLSFELPAALIGFDLKVLFAGLYWLTPLIAVIIGFIPGCGPQILTTTAYLSGAIPMGALLANAISNDGDALFPAIAISPKASLYATLITAIPAIILGYAFLFGETLWMIN